MTSKAKVSPELEEAWGEAVRKLVGDDDAMYDELTRDACDAVGSVLAMRDANGESMDDVVQILENGMPEESEKVRFEPRSSEDESWGTW